MCCIHFSNKGQKEVVGGLVWCEGGMCPLSSPTLRPVSSLFFHPLQHSGAICASVSCVFPAHSQRFPIGVDHVYRDEDRTAPNNNCMEIEDLCLANVLEISHLYHNGNGVGSSGGMKTKNALWSQ